MDETGRIVRKYRLRLNLVSFARALATALGAALFLLGGWLLYARRIDTDRLGWTPAVAAALAVVALASAAAWRRRYTLAEAAAYADWRAGGTGTLLSLLERPDGAWSPVVARRFESVSLPSPRWGPLAARLAPALLFALCVLAVPVRAPARPDPVNRAGWNAVAQVEKRLSTLEKGGLLAKEEAASIRQEVARIEEDLRKGAFGAQGWEAADSLRRELDRRFGRAVQAMAGALPAIEEAAREAQALPERASLDKESAARRELERALLELSKEGGLREWPKEGEGLDLGDLRPWLEGMEAAGLEGLDLDRLEKLRGLLAWRQARLEELDPYRRSLALAKLREDLEAQEKLLAAIRAKGPGGGGIDRGRADAPISFGEEAAEQQKRFKTEALPGSAAALGRSEILAIDRADPEASPQEPARGEARVFDRSGQEATWRRRVSPRDRGVVGRYFGAKGADGKEGTDGR